MQSVVLGRGQSDIDDDEEGCSGGAGGLGLVQILRYLLRSVLPLSCKTERKPRGPREIDAESIDPDSLERMINIAKKMKLTGTDKEGEDESTEVERLIELDGEREKPSKLMRVREGRRRRGGYWKRRRHHEEEDDVFSRRRRPRGEEEEVVRRWRRGHRRRSRSWEEVDEDRLKKAADEERQKKAFEAEWETPRKDWSKKSQEPGREVIYYPPPFPQTRHLLRPRPEDYIK